MHDNQSECETEQSSVLRRCLRWPSKICRVVLVLPSLLRKACQPPLKPKCLCHGLPCLKVHRLGTSKKSKPGHTHGRLENTACWQTYGRRKGSIIYILQINKASEDILFTRVGKMNWGCGNGWNSEEGLKKQRIKRS